MPAYPFGLSLRQSRASLQTKFMLTFFLLLIIVLSCFLVYVNVVVIEPLKTKTADEKLAIAAKISGQLDDYIDSQNQISQRILSNADVFTSLAAANRPGNAIARLNQSRKLKDIMFQALGPSHTVQDVSIYDRQGRQISAFIGIPGNPVSVAPMLESGAWENDSYMLYRSESGMVSFIRAILNQNGQIFGYLSIQMDKNELQAPTQGLSGETVVILDSKGQVIASSAVGDLESLLPSLREPLGASGVYQEGVGRNANYISYYESADTGWMSYVVTPRKSVLGPVNSVQQISILVISALLVFSAVYIYLFTRSLLLPIRRLRNQMLRVNSTNMNLNVDRGVQNNELMMLNAAFQDLLQRLQDSVERERSAVREEAKARNSALQAQIAPHFIHNTLYLISIAAQEGKNEAVSEMCSHLSDSLRYIVLSPYEHVSLAEELEHAGHYLSLVQHHHEGDLEWELDADEASREVRLPRLVIQPFIENSIEHAFKNTAPPWIVRIQAKMYNGIWAVEIQDNGDGFPAEELQRIQDRIHDSPETPAPSGMGNMGILNTVNRLKLMYPNRLFVNIFNNSDTGRGATIQIIGSLAEDFY